MSESNMMRRAMVALSRIGTTIFRNNIALAVVGQVEWIKTMKRVAVGPGDAIVRNARVLHAGLCVGSGDLIGWTPVIVTEEMVGQRVALFTSVETKDKGGRITPEQENFRRAVNAAGGIAGVVYSEDEAVALVKRGK